MLPITGDIVNLAIFETGHMMDHLKCIFGMFQHVILVQYAKQCFYWIPHPSKYVCRHQDIFPTLTSTGDFVNLSVVYIPRSLSFMISRSFDKIFNPHVLSALYYIELITRVAGGPATSQFPPVSICMSVL